MTNSATLRALIAPSDEAVCPTSRTIRNFEGSQMVARGFGAGKFKAAGPRAASFTVWCFSGADFAKVARFGELARFGGVAGFGEESCFGDLPCFDEPLKTSCSQPASLTSIGRSTNAAIAAMMVRRGGKNPATNPPKTKRTSAAYI